MPDLAPDLMNDAPVRGADPVNDELEVGFNAEFEGRWRKAEIAGRVFMALFAAVALAGLLGQGPFSHHTARAADHVLSVDYEPVARYGTATQVTLHLSAAVLAPGRAADAGPVPVRVSLDTKVVEPMGLQAVTPEPAETQAGRTSVSYTFDLPAGATDALVRFTLKPAAVGPVHLWAQQEGGEAVSWTQMVTP